MRYLHLCIFLAAVAIHAAPILHRRVLGGEFSAIDIGKTAQDLFKKEDVTLKDPDVALWDIIKQGDALKEPRISTDTGVLAKSSGNIRATRTPNTNPMELSEGVRKNLNAIPDQPVQELKSTSNRFRASIDAPRDALSRSSHLPLERSSTAPPMSGGKQEIQKQQQQRPILPVSNGPETAFLSEDTLLSASDARNLVLKNGKLRKGPDMTVPRLFKDEEDIASQPKGAWLPGMEGSPYKAHKTPIHTDYKTQSVEKEMLDVASGKFKAYTKKKMSLAAAAGLDAKETVLQTTTSAKPKKSIWSLFRSKSDAVPKETKSTKLIGGKKISTSSSTSSSAKAPVRADLKKLRTVQSAPPQL